MLEPLCKEDDDMMAITRAAWRKLDRMCFDVAGNPHELRVGQYPTGRMAVIVLGPQGPECKLTFNLPDEKLPSDEAFFVHRQTLQHSRHVLEALIERGIIAPTRYAAVPYGDFDAVAEIWQITPCSYPSWVRSRAC